jgi:flavin reductase (DIM6/NTAB) family NADH-FMN oxidoreductase RutF
MRDFVSAELGYEAAYRLLTCCVVPRPIAWVVSLSATGTVNLAPFSCFTYLAPLPPMIGFSVGTRSGRPKDTAANIRDTRHFSVNIASEDELDALEASSAEYGPEESESQALDIALAPGRLLPVPRIESAPIALECTLDRIVELGDSAGHQCIIGRVAGVRVDPDVLVDGNIDPSRLRPLARLGRGRYAQVGGMLEPARRSRFVLSSGKASE